VNRRRSPLPARDLGGKDTCRRMNHACSRKEEEEEVLEEDKIITTRRSLLQ
jgi:hypothetical protein